VIEERELAARIDRSSLAMIVLDLADQRVILANESMAVLCGRPLTKLIGLPAVVLLGEGEAKSSEAMRLLGSGAVDSYSAKRRLATGDGAAQDVWVWAQRFVMDGRPVVCGLVLPRDPSEVGDELLGRYIDAASLLEIVHFDDADLLVASLRRTEETRRPSTVDVRLSNPHGGWRDVRCFISLTADNEVGVELADPWRDVSDEPDSERFERVERHVRRIVEDLEAVAQARPSPIHPSHRSTIEKLPGRQRQIVDALLNGDRTSTIAATMYVCPSTVRNHLSQVYRVFGVHSQAELLAALRAPKRSV
jgi:DNA-binding CsgD family transcriptional regulator